MSGQYEMFDALPELEIGATATFKAPTFPLWTESKAQLIATYLRYFVYITKHGAYIDGFTGPQDPNHLDTWAAKLVLESEPRRLRNFYLCDANARRISAIKKLRNEQPEVRGRSIEIYHGDFNVVVDEVLRQSGLGPKVASFCLLDQRTFECHWSTVQKIAQHKPNNKIEIFYFLGTGWLDRAISGTRDKTKLLNWWGKEGWAAIKGLSPHARSDLFCNRFRDEFGYRHVNGWPIHRHDAGGGRIMYYMIHASDHDQAPGLMSRAYRRSTGTPLNEEQIAFEFAVAGESAPPH